MNYKEAIDFIHGSYKFGKKSGLNNIKTLLSFMGNPQEGQKFIHIAGTNGKGSTAAFIKTILIEAGFKTGLFTSPFLERFNERIQVNNEQIPDIELADVTYFVKKHIESVLNNGYEHPTEFEIVTAIGFEYFKRTKCDFIVLEVGLGGKLDSTNTITKSILSIITSISYDHTDILGNTLSEIASQKAGILKQNGTLILFPQAKEARDVILKEAQKTKNTVIELKNDRNSCEDSFNFEHLKNLSINLMGEHQILNAKLAIASCLKLKEKGYSITDKNIKNGLSKATWPGRFEIVSKTPLIIIDAAHNLQSTIALRNTLNKHYKTYKKIIVLGLLKNKDVNGIIDALVPIASIILTVTPNNTNAINAKELKDIIKARHPESLVEYKENIFETINSIPEDTLICACGSLYYIGEFKSRIT